MGGSYRHGTEESYTKHKCKCVLCVAWFNNSKVQLSTLEAAPTPLVESQPPQMDLPDIVSFMHSGRFNEIFIDHLQDEWAATIKADGDKYVGFGHLPDYALFQAIQRFYSSQPNTGPITITYDQSTHETSEGRALDKSDTIEIERIWAGEESEDILPLLEGKVVGSSNAEK